MALESFIRDFGLDAGDQVSRNTIQGNIVSTFQVRATSKPSISLYHPLWILTHARPVASSAPF